MTTKKNNWQIPEEHPAKIKISSALKSAGGLAAVKNSFKHMLSSMPFWRGQKILAKINQYHGFDCPGCAWPDPDHERSGFEYCENGAKAMAYEATTKIIGPEFFKKYSVNELAKKSDYWMGQQGRLVHPMILAEGDTHYRPIEYAKVYDLIAEKINQLQHPDEAVFYTSGRTSNEAAFLYQLLARVIGTNNLPDCSNMCHESSGVALNESIGIGKGTVTLEDFSHAQVILIFGQNPGTNHPRMMTALEKAALNGCEIVAINPLAEAGLLNFSHPQKFSGIVGSGTSLSKIHLPLKINSDAWLIRALAYYLIQLKAMDHQFIAEKTIGFADYVAQIEKVNLTEVELMTGLEREQIHQLAKIIASKKTLISCWAMGLTQHKNAVATIQEIVNLHLLLGQLGIPGAGLCPVRGHSNVQGDRTMGIVEKPSSDFLEKLGKHFHFCPPTHHGYDVVHSIEAMEHGKVQFFMCMGGNFLSASPDTEKTAKVLHELNTVVHVSTHLNRNHLVAGKNSLILPCLARSDAGQMVSVENSMGIVHSSQGFLPPLSPHLPSEVEIVCEIGKRIHPQKSAKIMWHQFQKNHQTIRQSIEAVIPGFENYNQKILRPEGFYLPNPIRDQRSFPTIDRLAHFSVQSDDYWNPKNHLQLKENELLMMTIRSHDQFNTTIYGLNDRYRGVHFGRRVLFIGQQDMKLRNLKKGDRVNLVSFYQGQRREALDFVIIPYDIPEKCVATYFPEGNVLVPLESRAEKSHTPTSKSIVITIDLIS